LYVCTGCGWRGPAKGKRSSSRKSNNHTARKPDCPYGPCLVLERAPGQSDKEAAEAYLARCTPEQCDMGMPPTGGCAPCMPTPEGREEGYQWVAVQIPEGKGPGETFEHLNHNGRYTMTVTVPEVAKAGEILGVEMGNKRRRSDRAVQESAARKADTVERAAAKCAAAERDAAERADAERAAAELATNERALPGRLAAEIAARSDALSAADGSPQVQGGGQTGFTIYGDLQP
jgi:hypothetical protein